MSTTPLPQPMSETSGIQGGVQQYSDYLKAQIASQANTTGLTQMGPNTGGAQAPVQRQLQQPGPQSNRTFGPGEGAARKRESMQNLVKSAQGVANKFAQYSQDKQKREYEQTIGRFTGATQGVNQAQAQIQQAAQALKQNPQDPQAQQMMQQAQGALKQNQTILNDMANDKKAHKVITKAFGIDDKNADSPERAAAKAVLQKQMGVGGGAAGILSQLPQTQQLSPAAQSQQMARQAGVVGAPATQGQVLAAAGRESSEQHKDVRADQSEAGKDTRAAQTMEVRREALGLDKDNNPLPVDKLAPTIRAKVEEARSLEEYHSAQTEFVRARQAAMQDPNSLTNRIAMLRAQGSMLGSQARMMGAVTGRMNYDMRALGTDAKGAPLPGTINVGGQTVGTGVASNLEKVLTQQAAFTDIRGAMNNLEASALEMKQAGLPINKANLVAFTQEHDNATFNALLKSNVGQTLTSQQRDYVIAYHQAVENISALRSTLKGSTAQANIDRMIKTLPGPGTPNYEYANAQIKAIYGQLDRLGTGIPNLNVKSGAVTPKGKPDKAVDDFLLNIK